MKKFLILIAVLLVSPLLLIQESSASSSPIKFYDPAIIFHEGFEGSTNFAEYDHLYSGHEVEIQSDQAISGSQSLTTYVTNAPGQWVDTLAIKKDFTQIKGANAFLVSGKIQTTNYQQMMVEVRKNYDGNTVNNMPYEFILTIDETNKTLGRPCYNGWYNACTTLNIYNEVFNMDSNGVIHFEFEFSSNEPVTLAFRGVIKNLSEVAIMTFDDLLIAEKPQMTEDFEVVVGNFWEATAFWANSGGIETDPAKVVSGSKSLRYDITSWTLGGLTNSKYQPPKEVPLKLSFELRNENGKVFLLATPWSPLYFEFQYDFETNTLSHPGLSTASATLENGILYAEMYFTIPASIDLQNFNFYGNRLNESVPGFYYLDNFKVEVLDKDPIVIPEFNVGYAITKTEKMAYRTNLDVADIISVKDEDGQPLDEADYEVTKFGFKFENAYLDGLTAKMGYQFTLETTYGDHVIVLDIYDVRPILTPISASYVKSLKQDLIFDIDLVDEDLVAIKLDDTVILPANMQLSADKLILKSALFTDLLPDTYTLSVQTKGGIRYVEIEVVAGLTPVVGAPFTFQMGTLTDLAIQINIPVNLITQIKMDGTIIAEANYTLVAGTLTLKQAYLSTLSLGNHEVTIETATSGSTFSFNVNVTAIAPVPQATTYTYDVFTQENLVIPINLQGLTITSVSFNSQTLATNFSYASGQLTINKVLLSSLALGDYQLVVTTAGGQATITITISNTAEINDVIEITVPQTPLTIQKGAAFNPLTHITYEDNIGDATVTTSSHLNTNISGRYVVTVVVTDIQGNISFDYFIVIVEGSEYTVTISYVNQTKERGSIDEAILDTNRKFWINF